MKNINEILKGLKNQLEVSLPIMEGREKGSLVLDVDMTVTDWGYLVDHEKEQEYVCFIVKEDPSNFYFGGSVATDKFKNIDKIDSDNLQTLKEHGIPVMFVQKMSKSSNMKYNDMVIRA